MKLLSFLLMSLPFVAAVIAQPIPASKRLLVVSGGGSRGAWGVGIANFLDSTGKRYAHVVGTSTGSLMAPLILLRKFETLNRAYTSVSQKDIFNVNPFRKNGSLRLLNVLCRFNKPSLGTTENLRNLIRQFVTPADYAQIRTAQPALDFTVSVVNLRTYEALYQSASQNPDYEQMINWIWASANEPVFMSPYIVTNAGGTDDVYVDGGVRNPIPIRQGLQIAFDQRYEAVDIIVNGLPSTDEPAATWPDGKATLFKVLLRTVNTYGASVREMNITIGTLLDELNRLQTGQPAEADTLAGQRAPAESEPGVELTFYFMPEALYNRIPNELIFDSATMTALLEAGRRGEYVQVPQPQPPGPGPLTIDRVRPATAGTQSFRLSRAALGRLLDKLK